MHPISTEAIATFLSQKRCYLQTYSVKVQRLPHTRFHNAPKSTCVIHSTTIHIFLHSLDPRPVKIISKLRIFVNKNPPRRADFDDNLCAQKLPSGADYRNTRCKATPGGDSGGVLHSVIIIADGGWVSITHCVQDYRLPETFLRSQKDLSLKPLL